MSRREERPPWPFAGAEVAPGTARTVELPVARQPQGNMATMPVVVVHGREPGPTVWVNGALHGDELNGVEIVRQLLLALDAGHLAGTVLAVPIVNVFGISMGSRYLPDRRDLNRSFPGSARGSLASQIAHMFLETVVSRCRFGIDFHAGSGGRCNLPQVRCDLDDPETRALADSFGPPVLLHSALRDGSLRAAARKAGARVLLYETGEALRFDRPGIRMGVEGALRVLRHLGMIRKAPPHRGPKPATARSSKWMRANRSGFCHIAVGLGQEVSQGEVVAVIHDSVGNRGSPLRSRTRGLVVGVQNAAVVHRGDGILHVAETGR